MRFFNVANIYMVYWEWDWKWKERILYKYIYNRVLLINQKLFILKCICYCCCVGYRKNMWQVTSDKKLAVVIQPLISLNWVYRAGLVQQSRTIARGVLKGLGLKFECKEERHVGRIASRALVRVQVWINNIRNVFTPRLLQFPKGTQVLRLQFDTKSAAWFTQIQHMDTAFEVFWFSYYYFK